MAISRHEAVSASGKGILPRLSAKEILNLPEEEFNKVAEDFGAAPEKLRELLTNGNKVRDRSYTAPHPPTPGLDESSKAVRTAFEGVVSNFPLLKKYTQEEVSRLHEAADSATREAEKDDSIEHIETFRYLRGLYRDAHLAECVFMFGESKLETRELRFKEVFDSLNSKARKYNLPAQRAGAYAAEKMFEDYATSGVQFQRLNELYSAYARGEMDVDQKMQLARLLNKARTLAMINNFNHYHVGNDVERLLILELAKEIRGSGLYRATAHNTSGSAEVYDMPGPRGIGGQSGYWRSGSRPHRDDNGASGGPNDK